MSTKPITPEEAEAYDRLDQRLLELGYLSRITPPITDFTPYKNRKAITIPGVAPGESIWSSDDERGPI